MSSIRRSLRRTAAALAGIATVAGLSLAFSPAAQAAPHEPFACSPAGVILVTNPADGTATHIYSGEFGQGTITFNNLSTSEIQWNSTGYNPQDGYIYGLMRSNQLLQLGADGSVTSLGVVSIPIGSTLAGAFDDAGNFYVTTGYNSMKLHRIDVVTRDVTTTDLSDGLNVKDFTYSDGYMWGLARSESGTDELNRLDVTTGQVDAFPLAEMPAGINPPYGGAFTYGDGTLGLYSQTDSTLMRVRLDNPASATPTATVISTQSGPQAPGADAAACFTGEVDLSLVATAPPAVEPAMPIDYSLTVHNNSSIVSSGWTVTDELPTTLAYPSTDTPGCTITGRRLSCTGGALAAGADAVIELTGTASMAGIVQNTAAVAGNDADPDPANNSSTVQTIVAPDAGAPMADLAVGGTALVLFGGGLIVRRRLRARGPA